MWTRPTSIGQCRHTAFVISAGIHVVHTDSIGAQLGHPDDIALALGSIDKRVTWGKLISNACLSQSDRIPTVQGSQVPLM